MADIFNELEDDLRRERIRAAWDKYGLYVLLLAVLIVAGTAGWLVYDGHRKESAAALGNQFFAALTLAEKGDPAAAATAFANLAATAPAGYAALAGFQAAAQTISAGDTAGGVARFDALAETAGLDPVLRDLARLRAATALVDGGDRAAVSGRLAPLIAGKGPFANTAREMDALAAFRAGDLPAARTGFQTILDSQTAPADQAQRASLMIALINGTIGPASAAPAPTVPAPPAAAAPAGPEAAPAVPAAADASPAPAAAAPADTPASSAVPADVPAAPAAPADASASPAAPAAPAAQAAPAAKESTP